METNRLLPTRDAAHLLGLSPSTLKKLRLSDQGPTFIKLGRRVAYDLADLKAWVAAHRRRSTSDAGDAE